MPAKYLDTRDVPLGQLERFPGNARRGDVATIAESITRLDQYRSLVVRDTGTSLVILAGNHTFDALGRLGRGTARCELVECDDDEARRINAVDNRSAELGTYDDADLAALLTSFDGDYVGTGWTAEDLATLTAATEPEPSLGNVDPDDTDGLAVTEPVTQLGDLFQLGDHRLLCGDATKRDDVARIMDGQRASIMVTDPPYGVAYHADKKADKAASIHGDLTQAAIPISFAVAVEQALDDDARVYLFGGTSNWQMYASLFDHHLRMQPRPIVWVKESFILRPNLYHSQFELVYFAWKGKGGGPAHWYGDRKSSDVWEVSRREADTEHVHPTQKPVEVCARPIRNSAPPGGLVYEPFGGSGSTLIAAEMLGRCARVIELDPVFCDVIMRRWQRFTGDQPHRLTPDGRAEPLDLATT